MQHATCNTAFKAANQELKKLAQNRLEVWLNKLAEQAEMHVLARNKDKEKIAKKRKTRNQLQLPSAKFAASHIQHMHEASTDVNELGRGKVNTIVEHDYINLWDIGMTRLCCWRLFCGNLYHLGFRVTAVSRPTVEYPGYFGFSPGFNMFPHLGQKLPSTSPKLHH
jgi:hypothetical protein